MRSILIVMLCVYGSAHASAQQPEDASKGIVDHVLAGLRNSREQVVFGECRCAGRWYEPTPGNGVMREGEIEVRVVFDYQAGLLRVDRDREYPRIGEAKQRSSLTRYIFAPDKTFRWDGDRSMVLVLAPDAIARRDMEAVIDMRAVGLLLYGDFKSGTKFEVLFDILKNRPVVDVERDGSTIRLSWLIGDLKDIRRTIWFDEAQGCAPIRVEDEYLEGDETNKRWRNAAESQVSWAEIDGTWIPTSFSTQYWRASGQVSGYELAFEWESINEPIDPARFTTADFGLPVSTPSVDIRLGKPIVIEQAGMPTPAQEAHVGFTTTRILLLGINVFVIGIAVYLYRRYRCRGCV